MKKIAALTAIAGLLLSSFAFAVNTNYTSALKKGDAKLKTGLGNPGTDITVYNRSSDLFYSSVPGTPVYDVVYPYYSDHIYNENFYGMTRVMLQDPYRNVFFDGYVCRYAYLTVDGYPTNYRVYVDSSGC